MAEGAHASRFPVTGQHHPVRKRHLPSLGVPLAETLRRRGAEAGVLLVPAR